jgi:hypothetical protein
VTIHDHRDAQRNAEHLLEEATLLVETIYRDRMRQHAQIARAKFGVD